MGTRKVYNTTHFIDIDLRENTTFYISDWAKSMNIPLDKELTISFTDNMLPMIRQHVISDPEPVDDKIHLALMIFAPGVEPMYDMGVDYCAEIQEKINTNTNYILVQLYNGLMYDPDWPGDVNREKTVIFMNVFHYETVKYEDDYIFNLNSSQVVDIPKYPREPISEYDPRFDHTICDEYMCEDNVIL